jgi:hypothetical protein
LVSVSGVALTVRTDSGALVTVETSASTRTTRTVPASSSDIAVGASVVITGPPTGTGGLNATGVSIEA